MVEQPWYYKAIVVLVCAPLLGFVLMVTVAASAGSVDRFFSEELGATSFCLLPFLVVGIISGAAYRRGSTPAACTWIGGFIGFGLFYAVLYREYQQGLQHHAWTGASLTMGLIVCGGIPVALVGSSIGLAIGLAIAPYISRRVTQRHGSVEGIEGDSGLQTQDREK
jgi:hypothetical protein